MVGEDSGRTRTREQKRKKQIQAQRQNMPSNEEFCEEMKAGVGVGGWHRILRATCSAVIREDFSEEVIRKLRQGNSRGR